MTKFTEYTPVNYQTVAKNLNNEIKVVHLSYFIFGCVKLWNTKKNCCRAV